MEMVLQALTAVFLAAASAFLVAALPKKAKNKKKSDLTADEHLDALMSYNPFEVDK